MGIDFEPLSAQSWRDPYPVYRRLRDEAPVHRTASGITCVSRHEDVVDVLRSPDRFRSKGAFDVLTEHRFERFGVRDVVELVRFLARARVNPLAVRKGPPESLITTDPPRHDELHVRCIVLDDGHSRVAIAICDLRMIGREVVERAKQLTHSATGIK